MKHRHYDLLAEYRDECQEHDQQMSTVKGQIDWMKEIYRQRNPDTSNRIPNDAQYCDSRQDK